MEKEKLQEYAARVSSANKSELVVVIYEATIESIEIAKPLVDNKDMKKAKIEVERAKGMINELMNSLDLKYSIAHYLRQLYIYCYHELCQGVALKDSSLFDHALDVLNGLLPSFKEVAKQDESGPVMENSQQIFAGLTYGRGSLNETIGVGVDINRGLKA